MPKIPPGDSSGIYYILVSNLPPRCTWQVLKDLARGSKPDESSLCIDHANIYQDSTDGWVCVKGKANFYGALEQLSTGVLNRSRVVADGRNETQWVYLRDHDSSKSANTAVLCCPSNNELCTTGSSAPAQLRLQPDFNGQFEIGPRCSHTPSRMSMSVVYNYEFPFFYDNIFNSFFKYSPPEIYHSLPFDDTQYNSAIMESTNEVPWFSCGMSMLYNQNHLEAAAASSNSLLIPFSGPAYFGVHLYFHPRAPAVHREARKVVLTRLSLTAQHSEFEALLYSSVSMLCSTSFSTCSSAMTQFEPRPIESYEVISQPDTYPKGLIFVICSTYAIARTMAENLNGKLFQGRILRARLAKEGIESNPGAIYPYQPGFPNALCGPPLSQPYLPHLPALPRRSSAPTPFSLSAKFSFASATSGEASGSSSSASIPTSRFMPVEEEQQSNDEAARTPEDNRAHQAPVFVPEHGGLSHARTTSSPPSAPLVVDGSTVRSRYGTQV